eukprot:COSAG02_NODE_829_length_16689_cov_16.659433_9_plen_164_part_00
MGHDGHFAARAPASKPPRDTVLKRCRVAAQRYQSLGTRALGPFGGLADGVHASYGVRLRGLCARSDRCRLCVRGGGGYLPNVGNNIGFASFDMDRTDAPVRFSNDPKISVFLLNFQKAAAGLTLTAATHVFLVEPLLNPGQRAWLAATSHHTHSSFLIAFSAG